MFLLYADVNKTYAGRYLAAVPFGTGNMTIATIAALIHKHSHSDPSQHNAIYSLCPLYTHKQVPRGSFPFDCSLLRRILPRLPQPLSGNKGEPEKKGAIVSA